MNISVLGCGRWGSFLSWYVNSRGFNTVLWGPEGDYAYDILAQTRANEYVKLSDGIDLTPDLQKAVQHADIMIISISSQALRGFIRRVLACGIGDKPIILCMKGIEESTGKRLSEVCIEEGMNPDRLAVWIGPGHIQDFTRGIPNCMTIDSHNKKLTKYLANLMNSDLIRFYYGNDIIGNEIGAATKNVMGICAGILDGLGYTSLKGALMARGAAEVSRLIEAIGGDPRSAYGLTHLGDYEATLFSPHSNNRKFGEMFAKKQKFEKLAEGVATTKAVVKLADKYNVDIPITRSLYNALFNGADIKEEIIDLFARTQKQENV